MANTRQKRKWVRGIAFLLFLAAVAYVITSLALGGRWNPLDWKKKDDITKTMFVGNVIDSEYASDGKLMRLEKTVGARSMNENGDEVASYTLSVTITPAESEVTSFAWTAEFKDTTSEWASGKSAADYVTITPAANNRSATVECLQAFGEPINVTCAYTENTTLSATCKFDYISRVVGGKIVSHINDFYDGEDSYISLTNVEYGVGTVKGKILDCPIIGWVELADEAYNYITDSTSPAYTYYERWLAASNSTLIKKTRVYSCLNQDDSESDWASFYLNDFSSGAVINENLYGAMFKVLAQNTTNQVRYCGTFTYTYGENFTQIVTVNGEWLSLDASKISTNYLTVTGVQMEQTEGVF